MIGIDERRKRWIKMTGLPPPEERGFVPKTDDEDEDFAFWGSRGSLLSNAAHAPHAPLKVWEDDTNPIWDNLVRAYEEDR